jgi:hypothetical protein
VASYASLVGSDNAIKVPKGYRNTDHYLRTVYDWEKKQGDDRTTNFDGSARKATGDVEPVISQKLLEQGYTWQPTGTAYGELDGNRFGGGGGGEKNYPMKRPQVREWTLTKLSGGNSQASSSAQAPAAKQDAPQTSARFEPSPELTNTATAIEALERAEEYQKQAVAATPSRFGESGGGLYSEISGIGRQELDDYKRFVKPLAEQRAMLGIQEVGESLGFNASRLRSDIKLPETMGIDDTLEYVKRFQGLIG